MNQSTKALAATPATTAPSNKPRTIGFARLRQYGLVLALLILCLVLSLLSPYFFTSDNLFNVARQLSVTAIVAIGMTFVIISGGIDLSVGSILAFSGVTATMALAQTESVWLAVLAGMGAGALIGLINGVVTAKGRIAGFITTLATMGAVRGLSFIVTDGNPVAVASPSFRSLGTGYVFGIAVPVIVMVLVAVVGIFLLNRTRFGRYVYATGGNETASRWTGLRVDSIKVRVYLLSGLLAGLAGVILAARLGSGQPFAGNGFELDVIAAVILGGTSLAGGRGRLSGTLIGVVFIAVLSNGLTLLNVSSYWQMVVKGVLIILAVLVDNAARRREN